MYTLRPCRPQDLAGCARCFCEGFFDCAVTENDRAFLTGYTQILIEKSNFTQVAEVENLVVGFICGVYRKGFSRRLARRFEYPQHYGLWCRFTAKYLLGRYGFSPAFADAFRLFTNSDASYAFYPKRGFTLAVKGPTASAAPGAGQ